MSINVTVHGNPISIRRGKMVAIDADKEFELRRKIRLQQVRQQSKEIAEDVRNRVRREKNKQLSKIGKDAEKDLKKIQEQKLASLQKQYQDCLEEFGAAYKDAEKQPYPDEVIDKVTERNRHQADIRGQVASHKQKQDKEQTYKGIRRYQENKKDVRNIENLRSKLVSSIHKGRSKHSPFKSKRRKKCITDIRINGVSQVLSDSDFNSDIENLSVLDELSPNKSENGTLDSQGNSHYSTGNDSAKGNDEQAIYKTNKSKHRYRTISPDNQSSENLWDKADYQSGAESIQCKKDHGKSKSNDFRIGDHNRLDHSETGQTTDNEIEDKYHTLVENTYPFYKFESKNDCQGSGDECNIRHEKDVSEERSKQKHRGKSPISNGVKGPKPHFKEPLLLPDRIEKMVTKQYKEKSPNRSKSQNKGKSPSRSKSPYQHEPKETEMISYYKHKAQLPSGVDGKESNQYCTCDKADHEYNCSALVSESAPINNEIRVSKTPKKGKKGPNINTKNVVFRKTIRSTNSNASPKESPKKSEKMNVQQFDKEEYHKSKTPTKCVWHEAGTHKKISPKKVKCKSPVNICPVSQETHLPYVPTITVLPESAESQDLTVRYYDHFNRFAKDSNQQTLVQKISEDSIQVCPPTDEETKYKEKMKQREEDARIRGHKALEKIQIHRDYQKLLEQLPLLQRKERLAAMATHNPTLHMSTERYEEYERKKQNQMENRFENMQTKSNAVGRATITLKSIRKSPPNSDIKQPYKTLDVTDEKNLPVLNVGRWENVESAISSTTQASPEETLTDEAVNKEEAITDLLKRVNKQKEMLLKEAANLPSLSNLRSVLNEEELLMLLGKKQPQTKILVETGTSPLVTKESVIKNVKSKVKPASFTSAKRTAATSSSDTSLENVQPKTKVKSKSHKKVKVLIKEEATQTSPSIEKSGKSVPKKVETQRRETKKEEATQTTPCCPNAGGKHCLCSKHKCPIPQDTYDYASELPTNNGVSTSSSDKLCEIIIKTGDDSNMQISHHTTPRVINLEKTTFPAKSTDEYRDKIKPKNVVKIKIKEPQEKETNVLGKALELSTSTSYMSPPVDAPIQLVNKPSTKIISQKSSNKELLQPQKQQTNIDLVAPQNSKEINPRLIKYIQRLLTMSRKSIDDLTISSVSDVSTPQNSVLNTTSNMARDKLQNVMDHFNLSVDDIKNYYLSSSSFSASDASMEGQKETAHYHDPSKHQEIYELHSAKKQFTSVSTSTDPAYLKPDSRKLSSGTSGTTDENEKYINYMKYLQSSSQSPQQSTNGAVYEPQQTTTDISHTTDFRQHTSIRSRSQSPKPSTSKGGVTVQTEMYEHVDYPKRATTTVISEEQYTYPSMSTDHQAMPKPSDKKPPPSPKKLTPPKSSPGRKPTVSRDLSPMEEQIAPNTTLSKPTTPRVVAEPLVKTPQSPTGRISVPADIIPNTYDNIVQHPESFLQFVRESLGMTVEEFSDLGFQEMFSKHMELTEYCHDRIRSLMDLIEKVRNDKRQIYTPSPVDQSLTMTSYLELPQAKINEDNNMSSQAKQFYESIRREIDKEDSSGSSLSQGAVDEYLLSLEQNQVPKKIRKQVTNKEEIPEKQTVTDENIETNTDNQETFVPMLQGIPKYTEVDYGNKASQQSKYIREIVQQMKARPPPSLLRANMRGQTDAVPHELSTIIEAETMVSSRNTSMHFQTPEKLAAAIRDQPAQIKEFNREDGRRTVEHVSGQELDVKYVSPVLSESAGGTSDSAGYITISPERSINSEKETRGKYNLHKNVSPPSNANTSSVSTHEDMRLKSSMSGVRPMSDTTSDSPDELESMLRKFKLEWAISLVRKTEQALALSSSSSASDVGQSKTNVPSDRSSDASLKETYLRICQKLTSSSGSDVEKSQIFLDLSQQFREFHDISEIPGVAERNNKSQQRTSTPVQHSKSTESQKSITRESLFKVDSELSSVRNSSEDNLFLSIPNVTLNTTNCSLNKRK